MNKLTKGILTFSLLAVVGVALTIAGYNGNFNAFPMGIGAFITIIAITRIVRFASISKDPKAKKAFLEQNVDAESSMISLKARSFMFNAMLGLELAAAVVTEIMGYSNITNILCGAVIGQFILYLIVCSAYKKV